MQSVIRLGVFLLCLSGFSAVADDHYQYGEASADGIGKFYMGREISHVMGHLGASWLERSSRRREERPDLLIKSMKLKETDVVVDLGAGTGYFTFPLAERVPKGKVLAVDIQPQMLRFILARAGKKDIKNIDTILASEYDPAIPPNSADVVLMVDAYHEFSYPREVMEGVLKGLKPGGRVVLVEYRGEDPTIPIKPLHKMTIKQARKELEAVGFEWAGRRNLLPRQHIMFFKRPNEQNKAP